MQEHTWRTKIQNEEMNHEDMKTTKTMHALKNMERHEDMKTWRKLIKCRQLEYEEQLKPWTKKNTKTTLTIITNDGDTTQRQKQRQSSNIKTSRKHINGRTASTYVETRKKTNTTKKSITTYTQTRKHNKDTTTNNTNTTKNSINNMWTQTNEENTDTT